MEVDQPLCWRVTICTGSFLLRMNDVERYSLRLFSRQPTYGMVPTFIERTVLSSKEGFASLYAVTKETAEAVAAEGTTQGFKGVVWESRLWLDFDSYEAAERAESKLKELGYDYIGYDTGGRGAHFGILREAKPSHLLPQRDKQWARAQFPECDSSIYTHLHPFRLEGTVHERTGERKAVVCRAKGSALVLPPLKREEMLASLNSSSVSGQQERTSVFSCYRVLREMVPGKSGERHHSLVRLVYALRDDAGVDSQVALVFALERNKLFEEPKSDEEVAQIVQSIYGR